MSIVFGVLTGLGLLGLILLTAARATRASMMFPEDMLLKYPTYDEVLPGIAHGGLWGVILLAPVMGLAVAFCGGDWKPWQIGLMSLIGLALSKIMHQLVYAKTGFPDVLASKITGVTPAGHSHEVYMAAIIAIAGLIYFCSPSATPGFIALVSVVIAADIVIGNHIGLGLVDNVARFDWCPDFLRNPVTWITPAVMCLILVILAGFAGGETAVMKTMTGMLILWVIVVVGMVVSAITDYVVNWRH